MMSTLLDAVEREFAVWLRQGRELERKLAVLERERLRTLGEAHAGSEMKPR
jgi:hypothetical protein